jgi:hypothetical protein
MSENNRIESKTYICITLDINTRFIDVIDVCTTIEDGKMACMKHMDSLATDDGHVDEVHYTKWEPTKADTGICMRYTFYDKEDNPKGSGILVVIEFVRDLTDIMNRLKDTKTLELDLKGSITHVKPNNEYMEYNFRFLSTKIHNGTESVIINAAEFRRGSPYIIMQADGRVVYGIAAYGNNDQMVFITTIDDPKDKNFGKPREITITAKDLCSIVKIKYIGMLKGEV